MRPDKRFLNQSLAFWANVRAISETLGYTERGKGVIKVPALQEMIAAMQSRGLDSDHLVADSKSTQLGKLLCRYFAYRAKTLNEYVKPRLMDEKRAKSVFNKLKKELRPSNNCPMPMNKQKGSKRAKAYLTCMVNMIIEANIRDMDCDYDPRKLTIITKNSLPLRTLARRVDGVYETLLDGMELAELREKESIEVLHYLIIDSYRTWWEDGRSYLCRVIDAMHMGYINEVLFGYEVIERLPVIVRHWMRCAAR